MTLRASQAGQDASLSARMAAMLEYHSCSQCSHLQGQRPSSSNMRFLPLWNGGRLKQTETRFHSCITTRSTTIALAFLSLNDQSSIVFLILYYDAGRAPCRPGP